MNDSKTREVVSFFIDRLRRRISENLNTQRVQSENKYSDIEDIIRTDARVAAYMTVLEDAYSILGDLTSE